MAYRPNEMSGDMGNAIELGYLSYSFEDRQA
jgi:hypothetical protein